MATDGFEQQSFRWMVGLEDTSVYPPPGFEMRALDEFELTGHAVNWREDLQNAAALGATGLRYGVNWPRVHIAPGVFDWDQLDARLTFANELGLLVVADLVHYGTPTWLELSFADEGYADAVAEFCSAFATRYRGLVDHFTPLNEPLTTASFCGLRGVWPPALEGWSGWTTVTLGIVEGMRRSIEVLREANPQAVILHVEASSLYQTPHDELEDEATHLSGVAFLPTDLLLGRVGPGHPLHAWLVDNGADEKRIEGLLQGVPRIDLMGVNYYPDLTPRVLRDVRGEVHQHTANGWTDGLRAVLEAFHARYGLPLVVTETSIEGDPDRRRQWLEESTELVLGLRRRGLDVRGYTWWPLLDFVDWSFASGGRNVEEFVLDAAAGGTAAGEMFAPMSDALTPFLRRMGLISLHELPAGGLRRETTTAAEAFRRVSRK